MNPLALLKEKLMVKPNVEERERVAVVIKGVKKIPRDSDCGYLRGYARTDYKV